jgi:hypothetical protein
VLAAIALGVVGTCRYVFNFAGLAGGIATLRADGSFFALVIATVGAHIGMGLLLEKCRGYCRP